MKVQILLLLSTAVVLATAIVPRGEYAPLYVNEHGTTIMQENYKDNFNNLLISDVPAHNGRLHTKWVFDLDPESGLMMQVQEISKSCTIQKSFLNASIMIDGFEKVKGMKGEVSFQQPLSETNTHIEERSFDILISEESIPHEFLPEKFKEHCPPTFEAFAAHTIDLQAATPENPLMVKENITNPSDFYDYVVPELAPLSRRKRECRFIDGSTVEDCRYVDIECPGRLCEPKHLRYQCSIGGSGCVYILFGCIDPDTGVTKPQCMSHILTGNRRCPPCCMNKACGSIGKCDI